jgi:hypothetical protein
MKGPRPTTSPSLLLPLLFLYQSRSSSPWMAESHHRLAVVSSLISATRSPVENVYETASYSSSSSRKQSIWDIINRWQSLRLSLLPQRQWSTILSPSVLLRLFRRLVNVPTELPIPRTMSRALSLPLVLPIGGPPPQARVAGALRWRPNPRLPLVRLNKVHLRR